MLLSILDKMAKNSESQTTILVNFLQKVSFILSKNLKSLLIQEHFGEVLIANIFYSRGISNNGIHMLDSYFFIFLMMKIMKLFGVTQIAKDNPSFILELSNKIKIFINGVDSDYHNIDILITASEGRMSILHGGMTTMLEEKKSHELFPRTFKISSYNK